MIANDPVLVFGEVRLLNVPHAYNVAAEIFDEDCYNFERFPREAIVIDVGAFYGEFALRCFVEKRCRVFAYEPCRHNREIFELNCRLNGASADDVHISAHAIGNPGLRSFLSRSDHPAGSLLAEDRTLYLDGQISQVICVSLGDEIRSIRRRYPVTPICVKLDCEGAEREIFTDTAWLDEVTLLAMEWHNHDGGFFRSLIEPRGFQVELEGGGPKPRPAWDETIGGGLLFAHRGYNP